jgi:hypothetical protein
MFAINDRLPGVKELKYFSQFAVPMMLYLYYRNLFLSVNRTPCIIPPHCLLLHPTAHLVLAPVGKNDVLLLQSGGS